MTVPNRRASGRSSTGVHSRAGATKSKSASLNSAVWTAIKEQIANYLRGKETGALDNIIEIRLLCNDVPDSYSSGW